MVVSNGALAGCGGRGVGDGLSGRAMEAATCIVNKSEAEVSRDNSKHKGSEVGPSLCSRWQEVQPGLAE